MSSLKSVTFIFNKLNKEKNLNVKENPCLKSGKKKLKVINQQ